MTDATTGRPKVVFFGSGPVAAESLRMLLEWCDIEAVITKPQPPHHRQKFPVITVAEEHGLPLHTAGNRRELDETMAGTAFESRVAILIDFGIIVSQAAIDSFELGIINSHFSLLPEWRGADPITFSILSGQPQTGVSLMLLVQAMDEGPLLAQGVYDIPADATTPNLTAYLIKLSDALLREVLPSYLYGTPMPTGRPVTPRSQEAVMEMFGKPFAPTYSRKLSKEDSVLDFTKSAVQLEREIRGFIEWPKSRTTLAGKEVIITKAYAFPGRPDSREPGTAIASTDQNPPVIMITTTDGTLCIERLKPSGKPEMTAQAFLAGNKL